MSEYTAEDRAKDEALVRRKALEFANIHPPLVHEILADGSCNWCNGRYCYFKPLTPQQAAVVAADRAAQKAKFEASSPGRANRHKQLTGDDWLSKAHDIGRPWGRNEYAHDEPTDAGSQAAYVLRYFAATGAIPRYDELIKALEADFRSKAIYMRDLQIAEIKANAAPSPAFKSRPRRTYEEIIQSAEAAQ